MNFVFATASARESMRNLLSRKADLLPQTALARHRTIGGHAGGPRMALRQRQFLGHLGAGPEEHLVRCLPIERWMRHLCVVDDSSEHSCPLLPACTGIERVLLLLVERFRRDDRAEAAPSPGGHGGTWDLNVLGNGHGATTNDVFAKAMVVGAPCLRRIPDAGCHPRRITCTSENLNDIAGDALANKKFRMSAYTATKPSRVGERPNRR